MRWISCILFFCVLSGLAVCQSSYQERIQTARTSSEDRGQQITALEDLLLEDANIRKYQDTIGLIHYAIAYRYRILEDHLEVIDHAVRAIEAFNKSNYNGYQYSYSLSFLGESYESLNQEKESLDSYFQILEKNPEGRSLNVYGYAINEIARKFIQYEDYESTIPVIDQFLASEFRDQVSNSDLIRILLSSSIAHSNLKGEHHLERAQTDIEEANKIYNPDEDDIDLPISIAMQKAALSLFSNKPNASEEYSRLFQELKSSEANQEGIDESLTMLAFNASFAFQKTGDFRKALEMAYKAKEQFKNYGIAKQLESENLIYDNLATAYLGLNQLDSAQYYIEKGLNLFPKVAEVDPSNRKFLLNLLYDQARIYYAEKEEDPTSLQKSLQSLLQLDELFDLHIAEQVSEYSINNLKNLGLKYYQLAIDVSFELNDKNRFWLFSEKTKGLQLLSSHARRRSTVLDKSQSTIDSLKREVVVAQSKIENKSTSDSDKNELEKQILNNRSQIISLQRESLDEKSIVKPHDLSTMIDILDRKELVLQYQYGREHLYLLVVSNAGSILKKIEVSNSINENITKIRESILKPESKVKEMNIAASQLFENLIEGNLSDRSELIIIPDRELFYLPFEILRKNESADFLIVDYDISYLPSGSFRGYNYDIEEVEEVVVFKPEYSEGSSLTPPLPFIKKEISAIQDVFGIDLKTQNDNSTSFIHTLKQAQVLHFGGHAIVDGNNSEQSYLALGDYNMIENRLRLGELYTVGCTSELVTLSACNTGVGGIIDGEGVSSITRGFLYAGAKSVINTLWTVDDQSTSTIVGSFYKYLKEGKTKSHALRMAKLQYLENAESYQRHPYYWAGIIGMGEMSQPIVFPINWNKVLFTIVMAVILCWFLTWRFNKRPMKKIVFLSDWESLVNEKKEV